jgi:hypothetical protein
VKELSIPFRLCVLPAAVGLCENKKRKKMNKAQRRKESAAAESHTDRTTISLRLPTSGKNQQIVKPV